MISILIPTRKRPEQLRTVIESAMRTAMAEPEFVCYVDSDDRSYELEDFGHAKFVHGPRIILSNMWNKCAAAARGDIFLQGNDDIIFRTEGWDKQVEAEFAKYPDRIVMVHGSDGGNCGHASSNGGFGPHPFVHRRWFETLGYVTPPFFSSDFGDTWINELANAIDRRKYLPFVIEHMHILFGKAYADETTDDRLARHTADDCSKLYNHLAPLREIDINKLKAAME